MTVEIRELHIKAVVGAPPPHQNSGRPSGGGDSEQDREALVALCVERVMDILDKQKER